MGGASVPQCVTALVGLHLRFLTLTPFSLLKSLTPSLLTGGSPPIDDPQARTVKEGEVHKTQEMLDKCPFLEVALNQQHVYSLFAHGEWG